MQSLADFLQFLLRQSNSGAAPFGSSSAADPLRATPFDSSQIAGPSPQDFGSAVPGLAPDDSPSRQWSSAPFRSPDSDFTPAGTGRILGGHPIVTGKTLNASQPAGILYPYNDPERRQADSLRGQSSDLLSLNPFGGNASPIVNPLLTSSLSSAPASTVTPQFWNVAPPTPSTGSLRVVQPLMDTQSGTEIDYPQGSSLRIPNASQDHIPFALQSPRPAPAAARGPEFPNDQTYRTLGIDARIHHPEIPGWSGAETDDDLVTPHARPRDGGPEHWSAYLQPAQVVLPSAKTGDPRIDRTSEFLLDALLAAVKDLGPDVPEGTRPTVFGTLAHTRFAQKVRELDLPGIGQDGVEETWSPKDFFYYGIAGSKRTDVYLRDQMARPIAIYDLKTGNARLTRARAQELRDAVGAGNIPVIEIRWADLTALQRWP